MDEMVEKIKKIKKIKILVIISGIAFSFLFLMAVIYEMTDGLFNIGQSVDQNAFSGYKGESGNSDIFSTLCQNCDVDENALDKEGVMGSEFYEKTSEMMNLYNNLEIEKQRDDEFDFPLLSMTIQYQKHFRPELFSDASNFGSAIEEKQLTNRDINSFPNIFEIDKSNAQQYFKWASAMLGTPYSLPDIDLRGLSGNLVTGRVTTTCVSGGSKSKDKQQEELIKQIIEVEEKFSGETVKEDTSFWNSILTFLGLSYKTDNRILSDRLNAMFDGDSRYEDLKTYVNLDNFGFDKCGDGATPVHTYTKFMNYEQYKVYLRTVFVPQNYINCEECIFRNAADDVKAAKVEQIINDIFQAAEDYRRYANMTLIDYDNITYGGEIPSEDLTQMSSPLKNKCEVTYTYGYRGGIMHPAIDSTMKYSSDKSLYAIADGIVESVNYYYTETFPCTDTNCPCAAYEKDFRTNGINIVIRHPDINGNTYFTQYSHLSKDGIEVKSGDEVTKGQKIANMGNTGCSSGEHLHFSLYKEKYDEGYEINPITLFRQCANSNVSGELILSTTDNFVTPEKCMIDKYTLDETITSIIKGMDKTLTTQKEAVKATAIVIRTAIMNDTNWCNDKSKLNYKVNVDIENNSSDLNLYNQVIETQGMVLNYSGETINNAKYTTFPCEQLPRNDWENHKKLVFDAIGAESNFLDSKGNLDGAAILSAIDSYNAKCISYNRSDPAKIKLYTITENVWKSLKLDDGSVEFNIPRSFITKTEAAEDIGERFSSTVAKYLASKGKDYTQILYQFYYSKTPKPENQSGSDGVVDISTAPGLLDAKKLVSEQLGSNTEGFKYGDTLSGSNKIPPASSSELDEINKSLSDYVANAGSKAKESGTNQTKAKIAASSYWLVNNIYYKVQYGTGDLSQYNVDGWNPNWNESVGLDSLGFVLWSLRQAGASSSMIQNPRKTSEKFTVDELTNSGVEIGDILGRKATTSDGNKTSNSHFAIVIEVGNYYLKVAHAVNEQNDLVITTYYTNDEINYQYLY